MAIIQSLYTFGQMLSRANLCPRTDARLAQELEVTAQNLEMTAAIQNLSRAILIDRSEPDVVNAINTHSPPLLNSTSDQLRQVALALVAITGSVCRRLELRFHWK